MGQDKLFVHKRYIGFLGDDYPIYFNRNGVLKKGLLSLFRRSDLNDKDYWYCLDDIPSEMREGVRDVAVTVGEFLTATKEAKAQSTFDTVWDCNDVSVVVNDETPVLPIVGNLLPSDGTPAYTVAYKNGNLILNPILVCWGCHWSELFTGQTKYGSNVFCLASDLTEEAIADFIDDVILLGQVPAYLKDTGEEEKILKL